MWRIFISNQNYPVARMYEYKGNSEECLDCVCRLLESHDITDEPEFDITNVRVLDNYIDYYGMTKNGGNLILAAFYVG